MQRGCFQRCKVLVCDAFQERHSFTELNESDFGFQTVSSRGRGAENTRGNSDQNKHWTECNTEEDCSINSRSRFFKVRP